MDQVRLEFLCFKKFFVKNKPNFFDLWESYIKKPARVINKAQANFVVAIGARKLEINF